MYVSLTPSIRHCAGSTIAPKGLELMHELSPKASVIGFLVNPTNPRSELVVQQMEEPARALGLKVHVLKASTEGELDSVFASSVQLKIGALLIAQEPSYLALAQGEDALLDADDRLGPRGGARRSVFGRGVRAARVCCGRWSNEL